MHRRGWGDGKNYICTVADRHGNPPQKYDIDIYNIYWRYILYIYVHTCTTHPLTHTHTLNQHHFQVWEVGNNFCDNSLLQVLTGGLRTFKCCHYNFFLLPIQKAKCYHSNRTLLKMSILHSTLKKSRLPASCLFFWKGRDRDRRGGGTHS